MIIPENKHLGVLCEQGYDWNETGKNLRYNAKNICCECRRNYRQKPEIKKYNREYNKTHKDKINRQRNSYRKIHRTKINEQNMEFYWKNKIKINEAKKKYRQNHTEKIKLINKLYHIKNNAKIKESSKKYYQIHKEEIAEKSKKYYQTHKKERNEYQNSRKRTDLKFRLNWLISNSIRKSLKRNKNGYPWEVLLGYTAEDLKQHLESLFTNGMNWESFLKSEIHIDHIIPTSMFNFSSPEHIDFKRCWNLNNLQPLWKKENLSKHNKLDKDFQPSLKLAL